MRTFYTKSKQGYNIKVGTLDLKEHEGKWVFTKHKPHYMYVVGGYGIQKDIFSGKKKYDIIDIFTKNKNIEVVINDNGRIFLSTANDWLKHHKRANYGDGQQVFLSTDYMKEVNKDV